MMKHLTFKLLFLVLSFASASGNNLLFLTSEKQQVVYENTIFSVRVFEGVELFEVKKINEDKSFQRCFSVSYDKEHFCVDNWANSPYQTSYNLSNPSARPDISVSLDSDLKLIMFSIVRVDHFSYEIRVRERLKKK
ncbi:MAG: hypothetical protein ACSHX0_10470 [Akkermansiaceae bacterium]